MANSKFESLGLDIAIQDTSTADLDKIIRQMEQFKKVADSLANIKLTVANTNATIQPMQEINKIQTDNNKVLDLGAENTLKLQQAQLSYNNSLLSSQNVATSYNQALESRIQAERNLENSVSALTIARNNYNNTAQTSTINSIAMQNASERLDIALRNQQNSEISLAKSTENITKAQVQNEKTANSLIKSQNSLALTKMRLAKASDDAANSMKSFLVQLLKIGSATIIIKKLTTAFTNAFIESGKYTENLNLFAVTFGESNYKEHLLWIQNLATEYGLANNELLKMTGLYKQLSTAAGIQGDEGTKLSKIITRLTLDYTSFYNISDLSNTAAALQSTIFAGQIKPARTLLGVDVAYQQLDIILKTNDALKGFGVSSKSLSQAQKTVLRTIQIMQTTTNAFGDMSKTINSSINQTRVLQGSISNLNLVLGDFINGPAKEVLIWINSFIIGLTTLLRAFIPFQQQVSQGLPENNFIGEINDGLEETQRQMGKLSFDKFEALSQKDTSIDIGDPAITLALNALLDEQIGIYEKITAGVGQLNIAVENAKKMVDFFIETDVDGKFIAWTNSAKLLTSAFIAMFAPSIIIGFAKLVASLFMVNSKMTIMQVTSQLLMTVGIFALIYGIILLVDNWDKLSDTLRFGAIALLSLIAIFTAITIVSNLFNLSLLANPITWVVLAVVASIAILAFAIYALINNWDQVVLSIKIGVEAIGKFIFASLVSIANFFISIANLYLGAWSFMINVAIGAINELINLANNIPGINIQAIGTINWNIPKIPQPQFYANGGIPNTMGGSAFIMNELGRPELMYENSKGQVQISNQESLEGSFESALRKVMPELTDRVVTAIINTSNKSTSININENELFRAVEHTANKQGKKFASV